VLTFVNPAINNYDYNPRPPAGGRAAHVLYLNSRIYMLTLKPVETAAEYWGGDKLPDFQWIVGYRAC